MIKRSYFYHGHCHRKKVPAGVSQSYRFFSGVITITSWFPDHAAIISQIHKDSLYDGEFEKNDIELFALNRL